MCGNLLEAKKLTETVGCLEAAQCRGWEHKFWSLAFRIWILVLPRTGCVILGELLNCSVTIFFNWQKRDDNDRHVVGLLCGLPVQTYRKDLELCLARSEFYTGASYSVMAGSTATWIWRIIWTRWRGMRNPPHWLKINHLDSIAGESCLRGRWHD